MKFLIILSLLSLAACGTLWGDLIVKSIDSIGYETRLEHVKAMIAKYKNELDTMDHKNLVASKLIGDQHRFLKNQLKLIEQDQKMNLTEISMVMTNAEQLYQKYKSGQLTYENVIKENANN